MHIIDIKLRQYHIAVCGNNAVRPVYIPVVPRSPVPARAKHLILFSQQFLKDKSSSAAAYVEFTGGVPGMILAACAYE